MKYRIIKLAVDCFKVQSKDGFFSTWETRGYASENEDVSQYVNFHQALNGLDKIKALDKKKVELAHAWRNPVVVHEE